MSRHRDDSLVLTLVRDLGLPPTFTIAQLCRHIEARRGRRIHLQPHPMPPDGPHGMWVRGECDDYVFFDAGAPPLRRLQIIGHELGHIVFDDEGRPLPAEHRPATLDTGAVNACTRTAYDDIVEQRCEWFGTIVVQRVDPQAPVP